MKPKLLLIYIDQSAKLGIVPYLSSIFHPHLEIDSQLVDQIDFSSIPQYQLILFSSALCQSLAYDSVCNYGIPTYQCRRDLNYTYLHRILEIPSDSKVCIVNDRKKNCEAIERSLISLGFTQYHYEIYYPGGPLVNPSVQYAITPGEARYAPSSIQTVIDIGNRNVDIATLCKIVTTFQLPETILNQITGHFAGYTSNFMRYMNVQINRLTSQTIENRKILDHLEFGVCITGPDGQIRLTNLAFRSLLCVTATSLSGRKLTDVLQDWNIFFEPDQLLTEGVIPIQNIHNELVDLYFTKKFISAGQESQYLFLAAHHRDPAASEKRKPLLEWRDDASFIQSNAGIFKLLFESPRLSSLIRLAASYAETDFPILILGDPGLYQLPVARFLHSCSSRSERRFVYFDASSPASFLRPEENMSATDPFSAVRRLFETMDGGTILVDNLERSSPAFQSFLCAFLKEMEASTLFPSNTSGYSLRIICSAASDLELRMRAGAFLPDLFYQLGALILNLPKIRDMREEIPAFYRHCLEAQFSDASYEMKTIFSDQLIHFLLDYDYPGNLLEIENLCRYFSCIYNGKKLTISQLPSYISYQTSKKTLTSGQKEILSLIRHYPHSGRNKLSLLLSEKGIPLSAHQIRSILADLADQGYIRILKTKQGCEITELGEYALMQENRMNFHS